MAARVTGAAPHSNLASTSACVDGSARMLVPGVVARTAYCAGSRRSTVMPEGTGGSVGSGVNVGEGSSVGDGSGVAVSAGTRVGVGGIGEGIGVSVGPSTSLRVAAGGVVGCAIALAQPVINPRAAINNV